MPRFLETNYLRQFQEERRNLLDSCLLSVPHHLDHLSTKTMEKEIKEIVKSSSKIDLQLFNEAAVFPKELETDLYQLVHLMNGQNPISIPESIGKETSRKKLYSLEIVPSSNPDSPLPDSLDDFSFDELEKEVETYVVKSLKECDDDLQLRLQAEDEDDQRLLEDAETNWSMSHLQQMPISPGRLSQKLKPIRVSDPFLESYEVEKSLIEHDRKLQLDEDDASFENRSHDLLFMEKLQKVEIHEDHLDLEEVLHDSVSIAKKEMEKLPIFEQHSSLEKLEIDLKEEISLTGLIVSAPAKENAVEKLSQVDGKKTSDLEHECRLLSGDVKEEQDRVLDRLESPLSSDDPTNVLNRSENRITAGMEVKSYEISPLTERNFISPDTKKRYNMLLIERDKYLDDTLSMTLKVPLIKDTVASCFVSLVVRTFNPANQITNCNLEVTLPWDPFINLADLITQSRRLLAAEIKNCGYDIVVQKAQMDWDIKKIEVLQCTDNFEKECLVEEDGSRATSCDLSKERAEETKTNFLAKLNALNQGAMQVRPQASSHEGKRTHRSTVNTSKNNLSWKREPSLESPLDSFMLLRTGEKAAKDNFTSKPPVAMVPPRSIVKAAKIKPSVFKQESPKGDEQQCFTDESCRVKRTEVLSNSATTKSELKIPKSDKNAPVSPPIQPFQEKKREIIHVELTSEYINILRRLEKDSRPLLGFLKDRKVLSQDYQFSSLKPDITRFLLRQQEKKHENCTVTANDSDIMKGIICLHALVLSADALVNYGIQAAIGILKNIREKHEEFIQDILEPVRRQLAQEQYKLDTTSQLHPKLNRLVRMVQNFLSQPERKIMILVRRYFECCYATLESSLRLVKNVVINRYPKEIAEERRIHEVISQSNVIVAELLSELQFCPWSRFSFVLEFEFREESQWFELCFEGNPKLQGFFAFDCSTTSGFFEGGKSNNVQISTSPETQKPMQCFSEHILIGSTKVTGNKDLLSELENRFNITLIERDYTPLYSCFSQTEYYLQPDIIVDERTCVILYDHKGNITDECLRELKCVLSSVKLKCIECYLVAMFLEAQESRAFPFNTIESLSKLLSKTSQSKIHAQTRFHLIYAFSIEETAKWILDICNHARDSSQVWKAEEWGKRFWLTEEMSLHERFLLSFPFFTSFSAQIALTATSLKSLLAFTLPDMKRALRWLPEKTIEAFHTAINSDIFEESDEYLPPPAPDPQNSKPVCNEYQIKEYRSEASLQYPAKDQYTFQEHYHQDFEEKENYRYTNQKTDPNVGSGIADGRYHNRIQPNSAYRFADDEFEYSERPSVSVRILSSDQTNSQLKARSRAPEYTDQGTDAIPGHIKKLRNTLLQKIPQQNAKIPLHRESDYGVMRHNEQHRNSYLDTCDFYDDQSTMSHSNCCDRMVDESRSLHRSTQQDNAAVNQRQKEAPKWTVMAGKDAQGAPGIKTGNKTWTRNNRNQREKIVFRPIPKRTSQDWTPEHNLQDCRTQGQFLDTPSTVRLQPSKKRRLTFEKDPSSRDGQTRLLFR